MSVNFVFVNPVAELEAAIRILASADVTTIDDFIENPRNCAFGTGCLLTMYRETLPQNFSEITLTAEFSAQTVVDKFKANEQLTAADVIYALATFQRAAQKHKTFKSCR